MKKMKTYRILALAAGMVLPAVLSGALCWSTLHVSLGAALGEAARRVEGILSTGGMIVVGVLAAVGLFFLIRYKKKKAAAALTSVAQQPADDRG